MIASTDSAREDMDWDEVPRPDVSKLITEDDTPVDNQFSEKQMRLLTESIHASWNPGFPFVAMANVGVYVALNRPAIVPDVLVTTHVEPLQDLLHQEHRAYFSWMYDGKSPDVVIEIVSNKKGGEMESKLRNYQHMGVSWYAVLDPAHYITDQTLTVYAMSRNQCREQTELKLGEIGLGLMLWEGEFEGVPCQWLRWCDKAGQMLLTGKDSAEVQAKRADAEAKRAASETVRATSEAMRATSEAMRAASEALRATAFAAKLRELGVDPDSVL